MPLREFINHNRHAVTLYGPERQVITIRAGERKPLSDYFMRYVPRYIRLMPASPAPVVVKPNIRMPPNNRFVPKANIKPRKIQLRSPPAARSHVVNIDRKIPGKVGMSNIQATTYLHQVVKNTNIPISNDVGVGILSYNRLPALQRLVSSIRKYTDLLKTTVFISDESNDQSVKAYLRTLTDICILDNTERFGVAGNSNRLLHCLDRFRYKFMLNDDVEILTSGWEDFYIKASIGTGIHHFCFRQPGIYGADFTDGNRSVIAGYHVNTITEKPHGAIMFFDHAAFAKVGYFDEARYGLYGMEHVDWSNRISLSGIQIAGFHDVFGSTNYFKIHHEHSAVAERGLYHSAKVKYLEVKNDITRIRIDQPARSIILGISYVIPFRGADRKGSIKTVLQNIKAHRYPVIDIVMVEQDHTTQISIPEFESIQYVLANSPPGQAFTKAVALNLGVCKARYDKIILHDADMLVNAGYTQEMFNLLHKYDGVHIGKQVLYLSRQSTDTTNNTGKLEMLQAERAVQYFEGGTLGCTKSAYIKIGGFNEAFIGYGCFCPKYNFVLTNNGYKPIEDVRFEDKLYTHEGKFREIELHTRHYSGEVYDIFVPGRLPIRGVTPEHPVLVKIDDKQKFKKISELELNDVIASTDYFPELLPAYNLYDTILFDNSMNKFNIYDNLNEFCYILGLYLAEGVIQSLDRFRTTYLFINKDENFLVEYVKKTISKLNQNINISSHYVKNNCRDIRIFNSLLAKIIYAIAGKKTSKHKIISIDFIKQLNNENISYLLGGMFDGDANHGTGSEQCLIYHTSSINLAMITSGLLRRIGVAHSFGIRSGKSYDLCINREFEHLIKLQYKLPPMIGSNSCGKTKFGRIYQIRKRLYNGPVYNFEVDIDHTYVVNGMIVHNCEDCEFFERLMTLKSFNQRSIDLVHLWHDRTAGWNQHHARNKQLGSEMKSCLMPERISKLHNEFVTKYKTS
jgi:intein/homing endonuclease